MSFAFRSIGTISTAFNATMTPGAPAGFQAGDLLIVYAWCVAGAVTIPDLSSFGFTQYSLSSTATYNVIWAKVAAGGDGMPTFQLGPDFQGSYCAAYTGVGATIILDRVSSERTTSLTSGVSFPSFSAPPSSNTLCVALGVRNSGSATGVSFSALVDFTIRASQVANSRPHAVVMDWIQTTPTLHSIASAGTSPADSAAQTNAGEIVFFQAPVAAASPVENTYYPDSFPDPRVLRRSQEFWQVPIELLSLPPPAFPKFNADLSNPIAVRYPIELRTYNQNLLESTLFGQDRVLTPVDWSYEWDAPQLPAALRSIESGFDASDITNVTNSPPYQEFNWTVPPGPRQWNRGYEAPVNLSLRGQDAMPLGALHNVSWDPPKGPRQPIANQGFEQSSLALFNTVPPKPPLCGEWPLPLRARQPVQDFVQSTPTALLASLTVFPRFTPSQDLPPRPPVRPVSLYALGQSEYVLLYVKSTLPLGGISDQYSVRLVRNQDLYSIDERNAFLPSSGPSPPPGPLGVRHVGRIIIEPIKLGEAPFIPFDFISGMETPQEVLVSATSTCTLYSGTDPSPQSIVTGTATVQGTIAIQQCLPTIAGNIYDLKCTGITNAGQILVLDTYLAIVPALP